MRLGNGGEPSPDAWPANGRRVWDPEQVRTAAMMDARCADWMIFYGAYSRKIWAFGLFATADGRPVVLASQPAGELAERMARAEHERRAR